MPANSLLIQFLLDEQQAQAQAPHVVGEPMGLGAQDIGGY